MSNFPEKFINKTFKNDKGEWALAAKPNLPIATWFVTLLLAKATDGSWHSLFTVISHGALFTWAWLEIFQGVNYFRRALGVIVLVFTVWSAVQH